MTASHVVLTLHSQLARSRKQKWAKALCDWWFAPDDSQQAFAEAGINVGMHKSWWGNGLRPAAAFGKATSKPGYARVSAQETVIDIGSLLHIDLDSLAAVAKACHHSVR